jgi:hypothetical protein
LDIETLEGTMHASVGDRIITGIQYEQYPCKSDVFIKSYEEVKENEIDIKATINKLVEYYQTIESALGTQYNEYCGYAAQDEEMTEEHSIIMTCLDTMKAWLANVHS